jgi:glycosyltransferase involved in cell wall biosynthesis
MILNAVMCVWNEEDIIESTVKHLFAQGCSNVFVVDNNSTDKTVDIALSAGARLASSFESKYFSEDQKIAHLNATVKFINENTSDDKIWWLYVDADEFPNVDVGVIASYINIIGNDIRAIHGYLFNHLPTHSPYHVQGYHPIDFQPVCIKSTTSKIPLLRYDKGKEHLFSIGGAHDFITYGESIATIKDVLQIHHFPYRNPESTFLRLKKLIDRHNLGTKNIDWDKEKQQNQICKSDISGYKSRYENLQLVYNKNRYLCLKTKSLLYNFKNIIRWYDITLEKEFDSPYLEKNFHLAIYHFFYARVRYSIM